MRSAKGTLAGTLLIAIGVIVAACATSSSSNNEQDDWSLVQPYHHPLSGVGGGAILGSILVPDDGERTTASRALIGALQNQQLSILEPAIDAGGTIPPRTRWKTDVAALPAEVVALHNERFPAFRLPAAYYGLAYEGMHDTHGNQFRYKVSARLHQRGALSDWSPVRDDRYSGQFFVLRLVDGINHELRAVTP